MSAAEMFNPSRTSTGLVLFEHWEQDSRGRPNLLFVSSTRPVTLDPGDVVMRRTWAPAGAPDIITGAAVVATRILPPWVPVKQEGAEADG